MRLSLVLAMTCAAVTVTAPARAQASRLVPPVDGAIRVHFNAPESAFGPGHRGVDFSTVPGESVRAAGDGLVTFAGVVAGTSVVTISHEGDVETTYSDLAEVLVVPGQRVAARDWIGRAGSAHGTTEGLHFGVKVAGAYVDPSTVLVSADVGAAVHLAPVIWEPSAEVPEPLRAALAPRGPGHHEPGCEEVDSTLAPGGPPNDHIAVAIAGITSKTKGADSGDMFDPGPKSFGYPDDRVYRFSYRGADDPDLHEDYERTDTYGDIRGAARRLGDLLRSIERRHPGVEVDLIAHSQGGIVARTYLRNYADPFDGPRVANLVTIASPHTGAPAAVNVPRLRENTVSGPLALDWASRAARAGHPIPDPNGASVGQLTPGSDLLDSLAEGDVPYGTRVLSLGIPNDLIVPADRTDADGDVHRMVPPRTIVSGHKAIVTSPVTRRYVYDFLRGTTAPCPTGWDSWGRTFGRAVSFAESQLHRVVSTIEGGPGHLIRSVRALQEQL